MIAQHGYLGSTYPWKDTNEEGQQVVWGIGDSHTVKRNPTGSSYGPTPTAGTVYQWDVSGQQLYEIGATDILQTGSGTDWGSIWPQMGISYFNATGRKPVFVTGGVGGTNYAPRTGDSGDWSAADTIYSTAKTQLDNCLAHMGLTTPKYIIVNLGINDTRGATALSTIETEINAFYTKLQTDYPRATILIIQIGRSDIGEVTNERILNVRNYLREVARNNENIHICASETALWSNGYYDSDLLHLLQTGNNIIGEMVGRWLQNKTYSKWARSIIASHFDDLSTARKDLIEDWITALGEVYFTLDCFYNQHTTIEENTYFDWCFYWSGFKTGATFAANDAITTNGSTTYWRPALNTTIAINMSQNDGFVGVKIKTNRSAAGGSTRVALGVADATTQIVIGQNNSSQLYYRYNDFTTSVHPSLTKLPDDSFVMAGRTSTTKRLYINGTQEATATVTSTGEVNNALYQGCLDNTSVASLFIDMDAEYVCSGLLGGLDVSALYTACEALIDGW